MRIGLLSASLTAAACLFGCSGSDGATGGSGGAGGGAAVPPSQYGTPVQAAIQVGGVSRQYWTVVPADYQPSTPAALVFNWHGLSQTFPQTTTWLGVVGVASNAILVYPVAQDPSVGFDATLDSPDMLFFDTLLQSLSATYNINPARVFSLGHSNGAAFNTELGCDRGNALRAVASVSAFWNSPPGSPYGCQGAVGWLFLYGVQDASVNIPGQPTAVTNALSWIRLINGCADTETPTPVPVTGATCDDYTACNPDSRIRWCSHPAGHDWPGTAANTLIWDFFQQFP
jgi:polyhydroxybutyrate depolymerase